MKDGIKTFLSKDLEFHNSNKKVASQRHEMVIKGIFLLNICHSSLFNIRVLIFKKITMDSPETNQGQPPEGKEVIVIDIELYFNERRPHPEPHPHRVHHYRIKIDDISFTLTHHEVNERQLLGLVDKSPEKYQLFQVIREGEEEREREVHPDQTIDLSRHHVKIFFTREKTYCFFVGKKEYRTHHEELTVGQILVDFAKVSPTDKTLAEKKSGGVHEFTNLEEKISLKDCPHFTLFDNTPTGLS